MSQPLEHQGADSPRSNVTRQIDRLDIHSRSPSPAKRLRAHCEREIAETPCSASPSKRIKTASAAGFVGNPDATALADRLESAVGHPASSSGPSPTPTRHPEPAAPVDRAALTWRDDEITGHEIDADPADDGEGINGLGFRPTPVIAAQRAMKRRQQVHEYRAREMSEARSRRRDKRMELDRDPESHGCASGASDSRGLESTRDKRSVRFAE